MNCISLTQGNRLNSQITKLLHELHFANTFGLNHLINPIAGSQTISMRLCSVETQIHRACCMIATTAMRGSRKFSLRWSDLDNFFLVNEWRDDPIITISGPTSIETALRFKWQ